MAATARKRVPAVVATISKVDAKNAVLAGGLKVNKYKRPCHLCGDIVPAEGGVLGGSKAEGWWAAHKDAECVTSPEVIAEKKGSASSKKTTPRKVAESASKEVEADKVDGPTVPVRGNRKVNSNMAAAKKTVARKTTARAVANKPAPVKRAVKKAAPNKPAPVVEESASDEQEYAELDAALSGLVDAVVEKIKGGTLDGLLGKLDDAIGERIDALEKVEAPAKKTAARKSTTPAASRAEKLAPVTRKSAAKESTGSGSASGGHVKPRKGFDYVVNPAAKIKLAGVKVKFKSYVQGSENKKASCELLEEFEGKPAGTRITITVSSLRKIQD